MGVQSRLDLKEQARQIYENVVQDLTIVQLALDEGEVITWLEIADLFRPRVQSSLFQLPALDLQQCV